MNQIETIRAMLNELKLPQRQQNDMCCMVLMALAGISNQRKWENATNEWLRIHDLLQFMNTHLGATYAENTRETIRKAAIHHFRAAALIEDNGLATNSPNYRYRLTEDILQIIQRLGKPTWQKRCAHFLKSHRSLIEIREHKRTLSKLPVRINGQLRSFSQGKHNELQKSILEEFAPRFAPGCTCLYVGDTTNRSLFLDSSAIEELGIELTIHNKLPDIILHHAEKNWLYFIEAVTSCGPISPSRKDELEQLSLDTTAGLVYVTAFPDLKTFNRFSGEIAWDTEVWISSIPDHMIHLNGDRFLGPR